MLEGQLFGIKHRSFFKIAFLILFTYAFHAVADSAPSFIAFESGQVRPLALSSDGTTLFAVNTPDNRLEVFSVTDSGLTLITSVLVGLEPVSVAIRNEGEVWVVNHLSDSVSVVDVSGIVPVVKKTLLVGDEPRDIVFTKNDRAFITTAHRGQHRTDRSIANVPGAGDPKMTTPGIPRADVWVFDGGNTGVVFAGKPLKIIELFGDTPRALTVSPDGMTVYAAIMHSGNQTASINEGAVCDHDESEGCVIRGEERPGGIVGPKTDSHGNRAPITGVIVQVNSENNRFEDPEGRDWNDVIKFSLPDKDVFAIDAESLSETDAFPHVGTTIFNMATNPVTGAVYVSNFDSNNFGVFEGPGIFAGETVQGHLSESRITVIKNNKVYPRHLNKHINYAVTPAPSDTMEHSLSMPLDMVVSKKGTWLAVAAFGSNKIGIYDTASLEDDTFNPKDVSSQFISVGGGPSGLALDEARNRMYVLTRFDNQIASIDLQTKKTTSTVKMYNPEPESIIEGRPFLYDATLTSSNGEASCAACHIFGDMDHLAWNLGNPDEDVTKNPSKVFLAIANTIFGNITGFYVPNLNGTGKTKDFHPNKGPMTTQTLKGMKNHGAMHWRGDRSTGFFGKDHAQKPPFNSELSFMNFIVAFEGLNGRESIITEEDMQKFTDYVLELTLPPNPVRALDNSLSRAEARGRKFYFGCDGPGFIRCDENDQPKGKNVHPSDGKPFIQNLGFTCNGCHTLDPLSGFYGTDGKTTFDELEQIFKVPQTRNVYTKVGMFGNPKARRLNEKDNEFQGDQIRGFGVFHDGGLDGVFRFMNGEIFNPASNDRVGFVGGDPQRRDIEAYILAFDADLAPVTGQQITLHSGSGFAAITRLNLLVERTKAVFLSKILGGEAYECDLVAKSVVDDRERGWLLDRDLDMFISDRSSEPDISLTQLQSFAKDEGNYVTFTCVPYGSGIRIALDRDLNGVLDGDEE